MAKATCAPHCLTSEVRIKIMLAVVMTTIIGRVVLILIARIIVSHKLLVIVIYSDDDYLVCFHSDLVHRSRYIQLLDCCMYRRCRCILRFYLRLD